jgi:hypothetical protein
MLIPVADAYDNIVGDEVHRLLRFANLDLPQEQVDVLITRLHLPNKMGGLNIRSARSYVAAASLGSIFDALGKLYTFDVLEGTDINGGDIVDHLDFAIQTINQQLEMADEIESAYVFWHRDPALNKQKMMSEKVAKRIYNENFEGADRDMRKLIHSSTHPNATAFLKPIGPHPECFDIDRIVLKDEDWIISVYLFLGLDPFFHTQARKEYFDYGQCPEIFKSTQTQCSGMVDDRGRHTTVFCQKTWHRRHEELLESICFLANIGGYHAQQNANILLPSNSKPCDMLLTGRLLERPIVIDASVVNATKSGDREIRVPPSSADLVKNELEHRENRKKEIYEELCDENHFDFSPFVVGHNGVTGKSAKDIMENYIIPGIADTTTLSTWRARNYAYSYMWSKFYLFQARQIRRVAGSFCS